MTLRKLAIEAISHVELSENTRTGLTASLKALPRELRLFMYEVGFSASATKDIRLALIATTVSDERATREEMTEWIRSSQDPLLGDFLAQSLEDPRLDEEVRAGCAGLLASLRGTSALPVLVSALRDCNLEHALLADRILAAVDTLDISIDEFQESLDGALTEKLKEVGARIDDPAASLRRVFRRLRLHDKYGWTPDPEKRILRMLSRFGGRNALTAMVQILGKSPSASADPWLSGSECADVILDAHAQSSALILLELGKAALDLYKKLKASGEITSAQEIPSLSEFMEKYGPGGEIAPGR
ncbi:MAG: hypothetical protein Q8P50_05425 [Bacillota bacterium]|nr:hypothetical protein [Bacillota bacterium]